jgi:flagellar motor protein MotB
MPVQPDASIAAILHHITLAKATDLARAGRYTEAEALLAEAMRGAEASPAVLDLCARMRAQQGRLAEAEALWTQALRLEPTNAAYQAGLQRIAALQRHPWWFSAMLPVLVGLVVILSVALLVVVLKRQVETLHAELRTEVTQLAATHTTTVARLTEDTQRSISALQTALEATRTQLAVPPARVENLSSQGSPPEMEITIPGVSLQPVGYMLVVTFESGLFTRSISLTPDAKQVLNALGQQLRPYIGRVIVHVIGHTDDQPFPGRNAHRDNEALGLARAIAVVEHMRTTTQLPGTMFSIGSLGDTQAPYPNDTPSNRARNRTVVLQIMARTKK